MMGPVGILPAISGLPATGGTYVMVMQAPRDFDMKVGSLGRISLKAGWYCYTGSAFGPGGLAARCGRHTRREKPMRWHLDYLSAHLEYSAVWYAPGPQRYEHRWASALESWADMLPAWRGFGASDCHCTTHLWYGIRHPSLTRFRQLAGNPAVCGVVLGD